MSNKRPKPRVSFNGMMLHCWVCAYDFAIAKFIGETCPNCRVKFEVFDR